MSTWISYCATYTCGDSEYKVIVSINKRVVEALNCDDIERRDRERGVVCAQIRLLLTLKELSGWQDAPVPWDCLKFEELVPAA